MRRILFALAVGLTLWPCTPRACEIALALAVDVSGSVDAGEYRLQMDGLAAALRDPLVSEALVRGQARLMLVQWTGMGRQQVTIPWTTVTGFDVLDALAVEVAEHPRVWRNYSTAIGEALRYTMRFFPEVSGCKRRLIDVSGDGASNEGLPPEEVHGALNDAGIVVNAIAIEQSEPDLTAYFFEHVIVGEGAFVVTAADFADYPEKIRKKLLREVVLQTASLSEPPETPAPLSPKADEKR